MESEDIVSIVKWVLRTKIVHTYCYYTETPDGVKMITEKLCEAKVYDFKILCDSLANFDPHRVTKKELFEARLADK